MSGCRDTATLPREFGVDVFIPHLVKAHSPSYFCALPLDPRMDSHMTISQRYKKILEKIRGE